MNNRHSLALAIGMMLLLSLSLDSRIISTFSDNLSQPNNSTTISNDGADDKVLPTADPDNDLDGIPVSNTGVLNADPVSNNAQDEPAASNLALDSSSDGTTPASSAGTNTASSDPSTTNSETPSQSNDSSTQTSPIPTETPQSGSGVPSGSTGSTDSLPSNGTSAEVGSDSSDQVSGESSSNQSAAETSSSGSTSNVSSTTESSLVAGSSANATSLDSNSGSSPLFDQLQPVGPSDDASLEAASSSDPNAVTQPISSGDGQGINFGDVSNTQNVSVVVSFDKRSYSIGDTVQVTIQDGDGNVDPSAVNTIQVFVRSASDQTGITVPLTETGPNTGEFVGTFDLTDAASTANAIKIDPSNGDNIQLSIDGSHPRAKATLNGVSQPGFVQIKQVAILSDDAPDILVGNAVELTLGDGAQLAPNEATDFCLSFAQPVETCGGRINLTMSYANAPLNNQQPEFLTIFQKVGTEWLNLKEFVEITVVESTKTVTATNMPFGPGIFTIGAAAGLGGGGGGGGGIGFPGAGIVLDFLAPVSASTPPAATGPGSTTTEAEDTPLQTTDTAINNTGASSTQQSITGSDALSSGGQASETKDGSSAAKTGNITIVVPGEGNITLVFTGLLSEGSLSVEPVTDKSEITALKIAKETPDGQGTLLTSNNTKFASVGTIFKIGPADARFNDTITVTIPYDAALVGPGDSEVRMLQYTGSAWQDVTTSPPANGRTVTGSITMLGPVVAAIRSD